MTVVHRIAAALVLSFIAASAAFAQEPDVAAQKAAMARLAFLAGKWSGDATVTLGPAGPIRLVQTEDVQFKLDGLVLLIEGTGRRVDTNEIAFSALATVSFNEATKTYRFRAFNGGRYLETELTVTDNGFEWGYTAGPVVVRNVMRLSAAGLWEETATASFQGGPPQPSVVMSLKRVP